MTVNPEIWAAPPSLEDAIFTFPVAMCWKLEGPEMTSRDSLARVAVVLWPRFWIKYRRTKNKTSPMTIRTAKRTPTIRPAGL